jgi:hypothetical protein
MQGRRRRVDYARRMIAALADRVLSIGSDPADSSELRFRKRLLVGIALFILPIGFLWGCLYWAFGEKAVALTPWAYVGGSIISLAVFARSRNFAFLRTTQLLLILVLPALGTIMLGGLDESSSVILWSFFAPLGAVAFDRPSRGRGSRRSSPPSLWRWCSPKSCGPRAPTCPTLSSGPSTS